MLNVNKCTSKCKYMPYDMWFYVVINVNTNVLYVKGNISTNASICVVYVNTNAATGASMQT